MKWSNKRIKKSFTSINRQDSKKQHVQETACTRNSTYKKQHVQETARTRNSTYKKQHVQETARTRNSTYKKQHVLNNSTFTDTIFKYHKNKILAWSIMKAFAGEKKNVTQKFKNLKLFGKPSTLGSVKV